MTVKITSILIALIVFVGCEVSESVVSVDKKKNKWLENLEVTKEDYQVVVTIPKSDSMTENSIKAEKQGRLAMASEIFQDSETQFGKLLKNLIKDTPKREVIHRSHQDEIAKGLVNMSTYSSYKSSHDYSVCYRVNKKDYEAINQESRREAILLAGTQLDSARSYRSMRRPMDAAMTYCKAIITLQGHLYAPINNEGENNIMALDKVIYEEMLSLRNEMSINCEPDEEVILNYSSGYAGILSFEILQGNEKTGDVNISVDVAGVRNESILVNGYSVLISNLPTNLVNPFVTLRIDLFEYLRREGNNVCAMVYRSIRPIHKKIKIKRVYPSINILKISDSHWDQMAFVLFKDGIESSSMHFEEHISEGTIDITPEIKYTEEERPGHFKITGQWVLNFGQGIEKHVGQKMILTNTSKENAIREIEGKLNSNLASDVFSDLKQILEKL